MSHRPNLADALANRYAQTQAEQPERQAPDLTQEVRELADTCARVPGFIDQLNPDKQAAVQRFNAYRTAKENQS